MSACRRDTFGDSRTIVFAAVRPSEQLPWIGWRLPSAASSQAPSSWDAFTQKRLPKSHGGRKVSPMEGRALRARADPHSRVGACPELAEGSSALTFKLPSSFD